MNFQFIEGIFNTFQGTNLAQYSFTGSQIFAVILFLAVTLKKYAEGATQTDGVTWGLTPRDLVKNVIVILIILSALPILEVFDNGLSVVVQNFETTAPPIQPLFIEDIEIEIEQSESSLGAIFNLLIRTFGGGAVLWGQKLATGVLGMIFWILDYMIYPIFLAERFFMLGILKVFFPFVMALAMVDKFRDLAYNFFKLYAAVYLLVPAFFLVNIFSTEIYVAIQTNLLNNIFGINFNNAFLRALTAASTTAFVLFIKFRLYTKSSSFVFKIFRS